MWTRSLRKITKQNKIKIYATDFLVILNSNNVKIETLFSQGCPLEGSYILV